MTTRERMLALRILEKAEKDPVYAKKIGDRRFAKHW